MGLSRGESGGKRKWESPISLSCYRGRDGVRELNPSRSQLLQQSPSAPSPPPASAPSPMRGFFGALTSPALLSRPLPPPHTGRGGREKKKSLDFPFPLSR